MLTPVGHSQSNQIELSDTFLLGEGKRRQCYAHPEDSLLCIKIPFPDKKSKRLQKRETKYYKKLYDRKVTFDHIATYHDSVPTNKGTGYLYQSISDGESTSQSLHHYLQEHPEIRDTLVAQINQLGRYLLAQGILFHDLNASNILCQKNPNDSYTLIIIDGLGDATALSFLNHITPLRNLSIRRRWARVINRLKRYYPYIPENSLQYL